MTFAFCIITLRKRGWKKLPWILTVVALLEYSGLFGIRIGFYDFAGLWFLQKVVGRGSTLWRDCFLGYLGLPIPLAWRRLRVRHSLVSLVMILGSGYTAGITSGAHGKLVMWGRRTWTVFLEDPLAIAEEIADEQDQARDHIDAPQDSCALESNYLGFLGCVSGAAVSAGMALFCTIAKIRMLGA